MRKCLPDSDIYVILSDLHSAGRGNIETARLLLEAGIKIVQYREKGFQISRKYEECLAIRELCLQHDACFIVNDDAALAFAVAADGLHIGQDDLPPREARKIIGEEMLLGLSVTTPLEIDAALKDPAVDYLGVGPVFATATKPDASPPGGLELLDYAVRNSQLPIVAIGGIKLENISRVAGRGIRYFAMVSDLVSAEDIARRVVNLRAQCTKKNTSV